MNGSDFPVSGDPKEFRKFVELRDKPVFEPLNVPGARAVFK